MSGNETAVSGSETAVSGNETAGPGSETAVSGSETAGPGSETAGPGSETAVSGSETAGPGSETAVSGSETAVSGRLQGLGMRLQCFEQSGTYRFQCHLILFTWGHLHQCLWMSKYVHVSLQVCSRGMQLIHNHAP